MCVGCPPQSPPQCPDGVCGPLDVLYCPEDCPAPPVCGNGVCEQDENDSNCPQDCGSLRCGDGVCNALENLCLCPADCPGLETVEESCGDGVDNDCDGPVDCDDPDCFGTAGCCGDDVCAGDETKCACPEDCYCGNGECDQDEDEESCPNDCGEPEACGDGVCSRSESTAICPADCVGEVCGNGECEQGEDEESCFKDCGPPGCGDGVCAGDETKSTCPKDCYCGNGECEEEDEEGICPVDCDYVRRFLAAVDAARSDRVFDGELGTMVLSQGDAGETLNQAGDRIVEFTETMNRRSAELERLVFGDTMIGKVYPGSLLWAGELRAHRLAKLPTIPGRAPVRVTFTHVPDFIDHDGTFSDFSQKAADVFAVGGLGGLRLKAYFAVSTSVEEALLKIGLSPSIWGISVKSGLDSIESESRTVAVMALDQTYYSAVMDDPLAGGIITEDLLRGDPVTAKFLADGAERNGEPIYVSRVDYGRRFLVSLSAETSVEDLRHAMEVSAKWAESELDVGIDAEFDDKDRKVWESVEGQILFIGGKAPDAVDLFFSSPEEFSATVKVLTSSDFINETEGGVPVSFEVSYANDYLPMQVFETVEFSGRIPTRAWGLTPVRDETSWTTGDDDTRILDGDGEIDSDDWTLASLVKQRAYISSDQLELRMKIVWQAREGNSKDGIRSFGNSWFESDKDVLIYRAPPGSTLRSFLPPSGDCEVQAWSAPPLDVWLRGHLVGLTPVTTQWGFLRNVKVQVDGGGDRDDRVNELHAEGSWRVWVEEAD